MTTKQYCVYSSNPEFGAVLEWLVERNIRLEVHLNRTRFWIPYGHVHTEFILRWYYCCSEVIDNTESFQLRTPL